MAQNLGNEFPQIRACMELVFRVATLTDEVVAFLGIQRRSGEGRACIINYSPLIWADDVHGWRTGLKNQRRWFNSTSAHQSLGAVR